jgi:flagellar hook protein FlgE
MSVGLGAGVVSTTTDFSQGVLQTTNVPSDMAISGDGWFAVQSAAGNNYLTRQGDFVVDSNGYLRTPSGDYLMGTAGSTAPTTPGTGFPPDKIQIPRVIGSTTEPVVSYSVDSTGAVTVTGQSGSTEVVGYISLQHYSNNNGLQDEGNGLYSYNSAAGANQYFAGGQGGAGSIQTGVLEASNVDLSTEFSNMIIAQRGFEASARVISVSDTMLQTVTNLKQQ